MAMMQGDVLPRLTSIFMQQMTGNDRQSLAHNRYAQIGEGDFDYPWGLAYSGGMYDLPIDHGQGHGEGGLCLPWNCQNHDGHVPGCL